MALITRNLGRLALCITLLASASQTRVVQSARPNVLDEIGVSAPNVTIPAFPSNSTDVEAKPAIDPCIRTRQSASLPGCNFTCPENSCMIPGRQCLNELNDCQCTSGLEMSIELEECVPEGTANNKQLVPEEACETMQLKPPLGRDDCTFICPKGSCKKPTRRCLNELSDCECQGAGMAMSFELGVCVGQTDETSTVGKN